MYTVPSFEEFFKTLNKDWDQGFKVLPPKSTSNGKNGILTGSMLYTKTTSNGRKFDDQIAFMGPPSTIIPPIREGRILYPKLTINLNRKDGKAEENDPKDVDYTQERHAFVAFIKEIEMETLKKIKEDPKTFFGGKTISPENVFVKTSFVEPEEDNYRTKFSCKIDLKDEARGMREDIDWNHVKIDVHDVTLSEQGQVEWKAITLEDISSRDKILPIFRSAYPYFEIVKNHRNGETEGYCKIQWCLSGLQRIEKVVDLKRKREDDDDIANVNPSWMNKIKEYISTTENENNGVDQVDGAVEEVNGVETSSHEQETDVFTSTQTSNTEVAVNA